MKELKTYIVEAFKINKNTKLESRYKYFPKTKKELKDIIKQRIKDEGNECDLNDIDVSEITDLSSLFYESDFNGDISRWDVSNVENMAGIFRDSKFNQDISNWDVSNVSDMSFMFNNSKFDGKNGDLSNWNVSKVLYMTSMFNKSNIDKNFLNQIKSWNIKKCTGFCNMFSNTPFFRDEYTINEISKLWNYPFNYN